MKLNIFKPYNSSILLLGIYPKGLKMYDYKKKGRIYSHFISNCQNLGANKMSFNMKVLVAQWCPALCDHMDCNPPGSSAQGFSGKNTGVSCHFLLQVIFPTQGSNSGLLHCRQILYYLSHQGSPIQ